MGSGEARNPWGLRGARCLTETDRVGKIHPCTTGEERLRATSKQKGDLRATEISFGTAMPNEAQEGGSTIRLAADSLKVGASVSNSVGRVTNTVTSE